MVNAGDKVRIITKDKEIKGVLMPNASKSSTFVKLESGYNIGIDKKKIKNIELIEERKERKDEKRKVGEKKGLKKIVILHTGGTIASKVDYESGGVIAKFTAKDMLEMIPELAGIANIEAELVENMMSEDMRFSDYQKIADAVKRHAEKGAFGIIIGHGTDTLAYTSAALSFMFEEINVPVILVGSQRSSDRGSSDAAMNLIAAARFIAKSNFTGVAICMHNSSNDDKCAILPATKSSIQSCHP
jgi:glutamyl-tRNA(Gln) amidotransferase subunit D